MAEIVNIDEFRFPTEEFVRHQEVQAFTYPMRAGSIGRKVPFKALVRRLVLLDEASANALPAHLRNKAWEQMKVARRQIEQLQAEGAEPKDINEALATNKKNLEIANLYCIYGFIKPEIVATQAEEDLSRDRLWVERLRPEDRIAYLIACNNAYSEQASHFESFRPQPQAAERPAAADEVHPAFTIGAPGPAGEGRL